MKKKHTYLHYHLFKYKNNLFPEGATELAEGRENFKGCIRDVVVAGSQRDWRHAKVLHNVLLDSCPITQ